MKNVTFSNIFFISISTYLSCWEKIRAMITKQYKVSKEAWWKCTWIRPYCTYCFRRGAALHLQIFSPRIPHGDGPCRIVQETIEAWYELTLNTALKNTCRGGNATCMKRSVQDDMMGRYTAGRLTLETKSPLFDRHVSLRMYKLGLPVGHQLFLPWLCSFCMEVLCVNCWNLMRFVQRMFEKISILGAVWTTPIFGARVFTFAGHWHKTNADKIQPTI
jgi:hypothetical protein